MDSSSRPLHTGECSRDHDTEEGTMGRREKTLTAVALGAMICTAGSGRAVGQHHMTPSAAGAPPPHKFVEMCAADFAQTIATGRGAGLAFVADQNGYPGPLHVL